MRILIFGCFMALSGCAEMKLQWEREHCNEDAAYREGMNDALQRQLMSNSLSTRCPAEGLEKVSAAYRNGFTSGVASRPVTAPVHSQRKWFCMTEAFMDKFVAHGPTRLEAENEAKRLCTAKNHEMHCSVKDCQENR